MNSQPNVPGQQPWRHPYDKFRISKLIIRSLDDRSYPNVDEAPGISSWFRVEPFDFYHNGLEVILWMHAGMVSDCGRWKLVKTDDEPVPEAFRRQNIWEIGEIPFSYIRTCRV